MRKSILLFAYCLLLHTGGVVAQPGDWKPVAGRITTPWAADVNPASPLPEYPRPQTGARQLAQPERALGIRPAAQAQADNIPTAFAGNILVPYAVESALSGVGKTVGKDSLLWYRRTVNVPAKLRKGRLLLHFGAVDWETELYVNGRKGRQPPGRLRPVLLRHHAAPESRRRPGDRPARVGPHQ
jgi:hypothetical protein